MNKISYYIVFLCIISFFISKSNGAKKAVICDKNKCYQNVNTTHHYLLNLINKLETKVKQINYSGITQLYNNLDTINNDTKLLQNKTNKNIKSLNHIEKRNVKSLKNITVLYDKIANISKFEQENFELNRTVTEVGTRYKNLKDIFYQKNNASKTCLEAKNKQLSLANTVNNISKIDETLSKNFSQIKNKVDNVNNNVLTTFQDAVKIKNDLDNIKIPESAIENYLNDTEVKLNNSVVLLKENAQLLEKILTQVKQNLTSDLNKHILELKKNISDLQNDLEIMDTALQQYENVLNLPNFTSTINNTTVDTIDEIGKLLNALENKIKSLNISENFWIEYNDLLTALEKNTLKIAIFFAILDTIPLSDDKLDEISEELTKLRLLISLEEQAQVLDENIKLLEQQRDEALQINCSLLENLNNTGILT